MHTHGDPARKGLTLMLVTLMLALGVAIPMLSRGEISSGPVVESEHDAHICPPAHDHTVCSQATPHLLASSHATTCGLFSAVLRSVPRPESPRYPGRTTRGTNLSRAPPGLA